MTRTDVLGRRSTASLLAVGAGLILLLAACSGGTPTPVATESAATESMEATETEAGETAEASETEAAGQMVTITDTSSFGGVDTLTVAVGETVTFVNNSSFAHTVTEGQDGQAVSDPRVDEQLPAGESVEVTFADPGDYQITCQFHSTMNMVVHVM